MIQLWPHPLNEAVDVSGPDWRGFTSGSTENTVRGLGGGFCDTDTVMEKSPYRPGHKKNIAWVLYLILNRTNMNY